MFITTFSIGGSVGKDGGIHDGLARQASKTLKTLELVWFILFWTPLLLSITAVLLTIALPQELYQYWRHGDKVLSMEAKNEKYGFNG